MKRLAWLSVLFLLGNGVPPQPLIPFCDLLRNPEKFNGQQVTVRATWRYGVEWSELYCLECRDRGRAWLDLSSDVDEASERRLKKTPKGAGIVNLTIQGTFRAGGNYGHMNGYHYEIMPNRISDIKILQKGMKSPKEAEEIEKQFACGGTHPR